MASSVVTSKSLAEKKRAKDTTVAAKVQMAVTGLFFAIFVLFHMYGNLKFFIGQDAYNHYAEWLKGPAFYPILPEGGFIWLMRALLIISVIIHAKAAITLWLRARRARGTAYVSKNRIATSYAVRTVRWGSMLLLAILVFHLAQFTLLTAQVGGAYDITDPYGNMVMSFSNWYMVLLYFIFVSIVGMHLRHGVWSALATLGANKKSRERVINIVAWLAGAALVVGFMAPPVAILLGYGV